MDAVPRRVEHEIVRTGVVADQIPWVAAASPVHEVPFAQFSGELHIADPLGKVRGLHVRPGPSAIPADHVGDVLFGRLIVSLVMSVVGVDDDSAVIERAGGPVVAGVVEGQHAPLAE